MFLVELWNLDFKGCGTFIHLLLSFVRAVGDMLVRECAGMCPFIYIYIYLYVCIFVLVSVVGLVKVSLQHYKCISWHSV